MSRQPDADPAGLLQALIRCASVTPEDAGAQAVVADYLEPLGFTVERLTFDDGGNYPVDNLFATRGAGSPHLLYGGHTDVVPAGHETDWTHPPFAGVTENGEVWGRGAVDMKGSVAAFCAALATLDPEETAGTISLIITGDEEAEAVNGTARVLRWAEEAGHRFDFALVGEPTSQTVLGDTMKTGRRGSLAGAIEVTGHQGHAAYPQAAKNPLPPLARIVTTISTEPLDEGSGDFPPSHLAVTSIDTGNKAANVIPARATARFNIRFNDRWSEGKLQAWLASRIVSVPADGCDVALEIFQPVAEPFVAAGAPGVQTLADAVETVTGRAPAHSTGGGTSDARFIAKYCPVVEFGGVGAMSHKVDERVSIAELVALKQVYAQFVKTFLGPGNGK